MIEKTFEGSITAIATTTKKATDKDGNKIKLIYDRIKLESANIDYDALQEFNPHISSTLLNIQPMPFKMVNFGNQTPYRMQINIKLKLEEENEHDTEYKGVDMFNIEIESFSVKVVDNIPIIIMILDAPIELNMSDRKYLSQFFKQTVEFTLSKYVNK